MDSHTFVSQYVNSIRITPQQYNKKSVKFDQGLDFLKVWRGKSRKTLGKTKENDSKNEEKTPNIQKIQGLIFLLNFFLLNK